MDSVYWEELRQQLESNSPRFESLLRSEKFDTTSWTRVLRYLTAVSRAPSPDEIDFTLLALRNHLMNRHEQGADIFLGIGKKGRAIFEEINSSANLPDGGIVTREDLPDTPLQGKHVVAVDDSIHTGRTALEVAERLADVGVASLSVATVLASRVGLTKLQQSAPETDIFTLLPFRERTYSAEFARFLSPLLESLGGGAIPQRPNLVAEIRSHGSDPATPLPRILLSLAQLSSVEKLVELPSLASSQPRTYHGTLLLTESVRRSLESQLDSSDEIDQAKIRVFVHPSTPTRLKLAGLVLLNSSSFNLAEVERRGRNLSGHLLSEVSQEFEEVASEKGLTVSISEAPEGDVR